MEERARRAEQRELAKRRQYHSAIRCLALHGARKVVKDDIRRRGLKLSAFTARQMSEMAELYAQHHWAKLVHDAQVALQSWKEFEGCWQYSESVRIPPELRTLPQPQPAQPLEN